MSCLSPSEWTAAASLVQALQPIVDATADLTGQKYIISLVVPFLYGTEQTIKGHCDT